MNNPSTMNIMVYEILQHINDLLKTNRAAGIEQLRTNRSRVVIEGLLKLNYDPNISIQLPPGPAPYKKKEDVPDGYCLTDLKQEFRRMRIFTDPTLNITRVRREQLWIQLCEGLYWKEADLINKIKDRRVTDIYDQLTSDVVREAFPNLLPAEVASPVPVETLAPVVFEDPSVIPEDQLIKESVIGYLKEEGLDPKKVLAGTAEKKTVPAQRKKPGPKPKAKPAKKEQEPTPRKKPGPKPKQKT